MNIENLSTLKIHKLTQAQYDRELEAGRIDENALYLTPYEESVVDSTGYATKEYVDNAVSNMGVPSVISAFTNDVGYQTEAQVIALIAANMPTSGDEVSY